MMLGRTSVDLPEVRTSCTIDWHAAEGGVVRHFSNIVLLLPVDVANASARIIFAFAAWSLLLNPVECSEHHRAERASLGAVFGDSVRSDSALSIHLRAAAMPPQKRFVFLSHWVLPSADHNSLRMDVGFMPVDPAPPVTSRPPTMGRLLPTGGSPVAPAIDLVAVAKRLNRLDEIRDGIEGWQPHGDEQQKALAALRAIMAIADEDFQAAERQMKRLLDLASLSPAIDPKRGPETVAMWVGTQHPETRESAYFLADLMYTHAHDKQEHDKQALRGGPWMRHLAVLKYGFEARGFQVKDQLGAVHGDNSLKRWRLVSRMTARTRGRGYPLPAWETGKARVRHMASHDHDYLYYAIPLAGDFSVEADLSTIETTDIQLGFGGVWTGPHAGPEFDWMACRRGNFRREFPKLKFDLQLTVLPEWMRVRICVKDNLRSTWINGRLVHHRKHTVDSDPWLAIHSTYNGGGSVRNLSVTGDPQVPGEINLAGEADLPGWLPYFDESVGREGDWRWEPAKTSFGRLPVLRGLRKSHTATSCESLLRYHRPMFEDGVIAYDFFHDDSPDASFHVHPALDRLAFLLTPEGVKVHWVTDGRFDMTGLDPANMVEEPGNRRGPPQLPLRQGDWNRLQLKLTGDTVDLSLNGAHVYSRALEAANQRTFGLFYFADRGEARIRNIRWTGDWPKQVPPLLQQELVDGQTEKLIAETADLPVVVDHNFADGLPAEQFRIVTGRHQITKQSDGVHVNRRDAGGRYAHYTFGPRLQIGGDFEITARFEDLQLPVARGGPSSCQLRVQIDDAVSSEFRVSRRDWNIVENDVGMHRAVKSSIYQTVDGRRTQTNLKSVGEESTSGRFRLMRRGDQLYYLFAEGDSKIFRLVHSRKVGTEPTSLNGIRLTLEATKNSGDASIIWKRLMIRAETVVSGFAPRIPTASLTSASKATASLPTVAATASVQGQPIFLEAEDFQPSSTGWRINRNRQAQGASDLTTLNGAIGDKKSTAETHVNIPAAGKYRVWVRHNYHKDRRGPFRLSVAQTDSMISEKVFDLAVRPKEKDWVYVWDSFDVTLSTGPCRLTLSKHNEENCSVFVRNVDCVLLTMDQKLTPDHTSYGVQTWLRVTLGDSYERPVQIHVFADHHRPPWYGHWHLSKAGTNPGLKPPADQLLRGGEQTPWCNITPMLYQDNGAILNFTARYAVHEWAERLQARFEFATAPEESAIVRTMNVDSKPNGLVVVMPPNLTTPEYLARFKRDQDFAEDTGRLADSFDWPTFGRKPKRIPFFVSVSMGMGDRVDQAVLDREWKTLDYFGFSNREKLFIRPKIWKRKNDSYCAPDVDDMQKLAAAGAEEFFKAGNKAEDIVYCMLTDEPAGQPSAFMAKDEAYIAAFRKWLKEIGRTPVDLNAADWEGIRPVPESARDRFPRLHFLTQRFRTRALGDFMATQRKILETEYGRSLPTMVNFSDGATYQANLYGQGVDYFELLDSDDQNVIWSEDWANGSSSYQCGAYNVDLMRAAARDRGQTIGHYLIAHANRKPWDIKLKAASETARGVRIWKNFRYGVSWGSHEGGPTWRSHAWYSRPETWRANAEIVREIGGAEDLLVSAAAKPAQVAILYSSSSDAWTLNGNRASGFERMHTWMALAHAQVPVDFVAERQVEQDALSGYRVCYLSGPNLTQAAAAKLMSWVESGGTLFLTAGAASRDEYNRPLQEFESLLPAHREAMKTRQPFRLSGAYLHRLRAVDDVTVEGATMEVLSVQQRLTKKDGATVLGRFRDGTPALVRGPAGQGTVYCAGFLPALDYIKKAETARMAREPQKAVAAQQSEHPAPPVVLTAEDVVALEPRNRLERSRNPWEFPAAVRDVVLTPVRDAAVDPPLTCSVPLVDAVPLHGDRGIVIPLANYTLEPIAKLDFSVRVTRPIDRVETVHLGRINFKHESNDRIRFSLPLNATDYVKIYYP